MAGAQLTQLDDRKAMLDLLSTADTRAMRHQVTLWVRLNRREMELDAAEQELSAGWNRFILDNRENFARVRRLVTRVAALGEAVAGRPAMVLPRCWLVWDRILLGCSERGGCVRMSRKDAFRAGLVPAERGSHEAVVAGYSDALLVAIIADVGGRNLSNHRDNETRWLSERVSAARWERKRRQQAGTWSLELPRRGKRKGAA